VVQLLPGSAAAVRPRELARALGVALLQVLAGPSTPPGWRWRSPGHRQAADWALGMATLLLVVLTLTYPPASVYAMRQEFLPTTGVVRHVGLVGPGAAMLLGLSGVLPVLLAARFPMLAWRLLWLAFLLIPLQHFFWWGGWPWYPVQVPVMLAIFCAAGFGQHRLALWWMWALTLAAWWLWSGPANPDLVAHLLGSAAFTVLTIALDSMSSRRSARAALSVLAEQTELSQAQLAILEERTRIARELHDVVAHHMSLIAVRAETAPYRLADLPAPVQAEFLALSGTAREALTDMRSLLGVLRQDEPADRSPQPQLSDLPGLIAAARQAGVPVELSAAGGMDRVPASVAICAYRIVQESLSNAGQHAPGAAVRVALGQDGGTVLLQIVNGPAAQQGPAPDGSPHPGHGLAGMRERVALLGGSLTAGPAPDGGFVVSAVLPLSGAAA
jgi:signal transduction histidine kinase